MTVPEHPEGFVQNRMTLAPVCCSQQTLPPPKGAQSAAEAQDRNMLPVGHCASRTQVFTQQTAAPSACEQLPVFAHAPPIG